MQQTWRWFGPGDKVTLQDALQAGAQGIVTSLHHIPAGQVWSVEEISRRQREIEAAGLNWSVVESLEITEAVKKRAPGYLDDIETFIQSLRNLAACGIRTVAYNWMPVFSWMRTHLRIPLANGGFTTGFDAIAFAAFDTLLLHRKGAEEEWGEERSRAARSYFNAITPAMREELQRTILHGLPGGHQALTLAQVHSILDEYRHIDSQAYRSIAGDFLRQVCPVAAELGIRLCVHPDDPPRPLLGLPRIVSTTADLEYLLQQSPEKSNALTFCTGALGVRADNDLVAMVRKFGPSIGFAHLRSTQRTLSPTAAAKVPMESFIEAAHLEGDANLIDVVIALVEEENRRKAQGLETPLPFRPDHGQELLNDSSRGAQSGYPAVGRLRGLAELRGAIMMAQKFISGQEAHAYLFRKTGSRLWWIFRNRPRHQPPASSTRSRCRCRQQ